MRVFGRLAVLPKVARADTVRCAHLGGRDPGFGLFAGRVQEVQAGFPGCPAFRRYESVVLCFGSRMELLDAAYNRPVPSSRQKRRRTRAPNAPNAPHSLRVDIRSQRSPACLVHGRGGQVQQAPWTVGLECLSLLRLPAFPSPLPRPELPISKEAMAQSGAQRARLQAFSCSLASCLQANTSKLAQSKTPTANALFGGKRRCRPVQWRKLW